MPHRPDALVLRTVPRVQRARRKRAAELLGEGLIQGERILDALHEQRLLRPLGAVRPPVSARERTGGAPRKRSVVSRATQGVDALQVRIREGPQSIWLGCEGVPILVAVDKWRPCTS